MPPEFTVRVPVAFVAPAISLEGQAAADGRSWENAVTRRRIANVATDPRKVVSPPRNGPPAETLPAWPPLLTVHIGRYARRRETISNAARKR